MNEATGSTPDQRRWWEEVEMVTGRPQTGGQPTAEPIEPTVADREWVVAHLDKMPDDRDHQARRVAMTLAIEIVNTARGVPLRGRIVALAEAWDASLTADLIRHGLIDPEDDPVKTDAAPNEGDRVRVTYGDSSNREGTWEVTQDGPRLRLDDGTVHEHVTGQVRREVIARANEEAPTPE